MSLDANGVVKAAFDGVAVAAWIGGNVRGGTGLRTSAVAVAVAVAGVAGAATDPGEMGCGGARGGVGAAGLTAVAAGAVAADVDFLTDGAPSRAGSTRSSGRFSPAAA